METAVVKINPADYGLNEEKANAITKNLSVILNERSILAKQYAEIILRDINDEVTAKMAFELRKLIKKNRTSGIEEWHRVNKEYFLRGGQFIDAIKRKEISENERMESALEDIEKYRENIEKERIANLQKERVAEVSKYEVDGTMMPLGAMTDDVWNNYIMGVRLSFETRKELEAKAEKERIAKEKAEAEERERIRKENEKLKAEALAKEKQLANERAKAEAERKAMEAKAAKVKAEADAKLKAEKAANEKLQAEIRAKAEAEEKAKREAGAKAAAELKAKELAEKKEKAETDKTKLNNFAYYLETATCPNLKSEEAKKVLSDAKILLRKISTFIREKSSII